MPAATRPEGIPEVPHRGGFADCHSRPRRVTFNIASPPAYRDTWPRRIGDTSRRRSGATRPPIFGGTAVRDYGRPFCSISLTIQVPYPICIARTAGDASGGGVLRDLGVAHSGHGPPLRGARVVRDGKLVRLPLGPMGALVARLVTASAGRWAGRSAEEWVESLGGSRDLSDLARMLIRVTHLRDRPGGHARPISPFPG